MDLLGDEETARLEAARLAGLDPKHSRPVTLGRQKQGFFQRLRQQFQLELGLGGQPLWLYRP